MNVRLFAVIRVDATNVNPLKNNWLEADGDGALEWTFDTLKGPLHLALRLTPVGSSNITSIFGVYVKGRRRFFQYVITDSVIKRVEVLATKQDF